MNRYRWLFLALLIAGGIPWGLVQAQGGDLPQVQLRLSRDWGYGGLDGNIAGRFSLKVKNEQDFVRVAFFMDDDELALLTAPPFVFRFHTDDYPPGEHLLWARAWTATGQVAESQPIRVTFLGGEEARQKTVGLIVAVSAVSLVSVLLSLLVIWAVRRNDATAGKYGLWGGTVCPRCGRPYAMHFFALNLVTHRLDRCPHCGAWARVRRQPLDVLQAAEEKMAGEAVAAAAPLDEDEQLRRLLDDSRYE